MVASGELSDSAGRLHDARTGTSFLKQDAFVHKVGDDYYLLRVMGLDGLVVDISSLTSTVRCMLAEKAELHRRLDRFMDDATDDQRKAIWKLVSRPPPPAKASVAKGGA